MVLARAGLLSFRGLVGRGSARRRRGGLELQAAAPNRRDLGRRVLKRVDRSLDGGEEWANR